MSSSSRLLRKLRKVMGVTVVSSSLAACSSQISSAVLSTHQTGKPTITYRRGKMRITGSGQITKDDIWPYHLMVTSVTIGEGVTEICDEAFQACYKLRSVVLPQTLNKIGKCAFDSNRSLESIEIPEGIIKIRKHTFRNCYSLEKVDLPDSLKSIEELAFTMCGNLKSIKIPEGVTKIGCNAFSDCESLENITIPASAKNLDYGIFSGCSNLKSAVVLSNIAKLPDHLFSGCSQLKDVTLPSSIDEVGQSAFQYCSSLENISIPNVKNICAWAFKGCTSLRNVEVRGSCHDFMHYLWLARHWKNTGEKKRQGLYVDAIVSKGIGPFLYKSRNPFNIGEEAFSGCTNLRCFKMPVPQYLAQVDATAFDNTTEVVYNVITPRNVPMQED